MKKLLKQLKTFSLDDDLMLVCPTCHSKTLELKKDTMFETELALSKRHSQSEDFDIEWSRYIYNVQYHCLNKKCNEIVLSSGTSGYSLEPQFDCFGEYEGDAPEQYYTPKIFLPELDFFEIPEKTPIEVRNLIKESFGIFFQSKNSAINKMRVAIEELLTQNSIPRYPTVVKSTTKPLSLHDRIVKAVAADQKFKNLEDYLFAIKILGNAGSHSEEDIDFNDVVDTYEFVNVLLNELYVPKSDLLNKAKSIRAKQAPLSN